MVIRFLEGDPDRPIVVGAVYNGANLPPVELPRDKTRSTVRTSSSPGNGGSNELRLEDEAGREEVHLHAQRDREVEVEAEEAREVRGNAALSVEKEREKRVLGSQELEVGRDDARAAGGNETVTVAAARSVAIAGSHEERVGAAQTVTVAGVQDVTVGAASAVFVGAAAALNVGAGYAVNVGGAVNELVAGLKSSQVVGAATEFVGAHLEERVAGDRVGTTQGDAQGDVDGAVRLGTDRDVTETVQGKVTISVVDVARAEPADGVLEATGSLKIIVGDQVVLSMTSGGEVQLAGAAITLDGSEIALKGGTVKKVPSEAARQEQLKAQALQDLATAAAFLDLELRDYEDLPIANEHVKVEFPDGTVRDGRTDAMGKVKVPGPKSGNVKVTFLDRSSRAP